MSKFKKFSRITSAFILSWFVLASSAHSACEDERQNYNHFNLFCNKAGGASVVTSLVGAIVVPGIGGVLGLIPGVPAKVFCDKRDKWANRLRNCENENATRLRQQSEAQQARTNLIRHLNEQLENQIQQLQADYEQAVRTYIQDLADEGYDITNPDLREEINQESQRLLEARNAREAQLRQENENAIRAI